MEAVCWGDGGRGERLVAVEVIQPSSFYMVVMTCVLSFKGAD
jgi:hypothetical protein